MIPKYVGPYLLLKDYGNFSFKVQLPTHMLRRGIHNVYHASLLRIHHPNDNRQFPGRLYSQIVADIEPEHENEWATDKIISHAGSRTDSIFEVLWHPGDKTWLTYDQVQDLNLLQPYLEAQGVSDIAELPSSKGSPPLDDPQTILGAVQFTIFKASVIPHLSTIAPHSPASPSLSARSIALSYQSFSMSFCPKDHYKPHLLLTVQPDSLVQLTAIDPQHCCASPPAAGVHPLQQQRLSLQCCGEHLCAGWLCRVCGHL